MNFWKAAGSLTSSGVALMPATLAILFFYTYPFFTGLGAAMLGDERFSGRLAVALVAAFAGLALALPALRASETAYGALSLLLPLVEDCVREVDLEGRRVLLNPGFTD